MPSIQSGMAKTRLALVSVASLGLLISACSGGGSTSTNTTGGGGTAVRGGTLYMLGTGDVDYMDPTSLTTPLVIWVCACGAASC